MKNILTTLFLLSSTCFCDILSTTGQIKFDTQMDGQAEMTLNSTGLGIGVLPSSNLHVNGNAIISDQLFVGSSNGSSNLNVNGTIGYGFQTITSSTTLSNISIVLADTSSANIILSLPQASAFEGRMYTIKKTSALNSLYIKNGGFIDNYSDVSLSVNNMGDLSIISNSGNWHILNISGNGTSLGTDNLIGWWKFDETSGNTAFDSSNQLNHGTLNNGLSFTSNTTDGVFENALSFDGVDDYVVINEIDVPSGNFMTLSCWARFTVSQPGNSGIGFLITKSLSVLSPNNPYTVSISGTTVELRADGVARSSSSNQNDNLWHHIVMVINNSTFSLYYDGQHIGDSAFNLISNDTQTSFGSSVDDPSDRPYKGGIDDIRIYNLSLNTEQISLLYNQGQ
jgi:hypothetical protein